jgi:hypothetical protein
MQNEGTALGAGQAVVLTRSPALVLVRAVQAAR